MTRRAMNLGLALLVLMGAVSLWLAHGRLAGENVTPDGEAGGLPGPEAFPQELGTIHLRVLNATEVPGLAGELALLVPGLGGCVVQGVGNAPRWSGSPSLLINRRLDRSQALALAAALGPVPLIQEWDDRSSADAVLVLGEDHARVRAALQGHRREK